MTELTLDSLPYADAPVGEEYEEKAVQMIEDELKKGAPEYEMPDIRFRSTIMENECNERSNRDGPLVIQDDRDLKAPSGKSVQEWEEAVRRARIAYEKERLRSMTNTIAKEEAVDLWKAHNTTLHDVKAHWDGVLQKQQQKVNQVNQRRQEFQQGQEINKLTVQREQLVQKILQLREAVDDLKAEVGDEDES